MKTSWIVSLVFSWFVSRRPSSGRCCCRLWDRPGAQRPWCSCSPGTDVRREAERLVVLRRPRPLLPGGFLTWLTWGGLLGNAAWRELCPGIVTSGLRRSVHVFCRHEIKSSRVCLSAEAAGVHQRLWCMKMEPQRHKLKETRRRSARAPVSFTSLETFPLWSFL